MPRWARISSTSRRLRLKQWYSHTAWLMISAGKRKPRYGSGVVVMPDSLLHEPGPGQPDNARMRLL